MSTEPSDPKRKPLLARLGPGLITGAADDDPGGIATHSQVGAQFGLGLIWMPVLAYPLMTAIQAVCARIGRVTGEGLAANMAHVLPRWLVHVIVGLLLVNAVISYYEESNADKAIKVRRSWAAGPWACICLYFTNVCRDVLKFRAKSCTAGDLSGSCKCFAEFAVLLWCSRGDEL